MKNLEVLTTIVELPMIKIPRFMGKNPEVIAKIGTEFMGENSEKSPVIISKTSKTK